MPVSGNQVYQPTTASVDQSEPKNTYIPPPSCCPGRKKRLKFILISSSIFCVLGGLIVLLSGLGGASRSLLILLTLLSLILIGVGFGLLVMYLRMQGHCNLPCWPTRAARLSQSILGSTDGSAPGATSRSDTRMTLAEESEERLNLMETENGDAQRIVESRPQIVFMS